MNCSLSEVEVSECGQQFPSASLRELYLLFNLYLTKENSYEYRAW
jgi:hypothetical protein